MPLHKLLTCNIFFLGIFSSVLLAKEVSFNRDIRPILSNKCFSCHGPDKHDRKAELRLDISEGSDGAYREKDGNFALKPGSIDDSELWHRIISEDSEEVMPPPEANKKLLTVQEKELIKAWINSGAKYEKFWAFEKPKQPDLPKVQNGKWSDEPIDLFVMKKLESTGITPSPEADKRTLIRRLSLDLTGLPPSREEVRKFDSDDTAGAYEQLVDKLLSREQYGEHMARYWLDLVRFADTNGMHKDYYRNSVAYRDWVIRAYNENLRYDEFVRYQLAGDLFPDASSDQLIASGFNRLHLIIDVGTALPEESFFKNVTDRVTAVGTAFMGMTVQCAACHDHKYDPITQKDYYSLFAFFNNIDAKPETERGLKNGLQPPIASVPTPDQKKSLDELGAKMSEVESEINNQNNSEDIISELQEKLKSLKGERDQLEKQIPLAMVMRERKEVRETHIMKRGQYDDPGEVVQRNAPEFLHPMKRAGDVASRMDLANWFIDKENPLTARVAVNRIWQQLFGVGLVKTSEDLGAQGEVPSHPLLLDYLTVSFVNSGWDVKALIKEIVLSKAYRQSSNIDELLFKKDPENRLLARGSRFRMDAEMIRDQILFTSGTLSEKMYGKSVKPPQPDGLWKAVTMIGERFKPDSGEEIRRRSLYTYWKRGMPPPQMTILNAPIRDACVSRRERTNTPSQALLLLNESEYMKAARNLAMTVLVPKEAKPSQRIAFAYETITSRLPDKEEQKTLYELLQSLYKTYLNEPALADEICEGLPVKEKDQKAKIAAWTILVNSLYNLDITKTRD
ncbi:MAG: PSD1 and planctomycete cytochrome C domain-containing protein [Verrucomicrobiota bacterium]|nr:PSD1 and planctomycete cytochrome C domain-containing protein [Verrucomicrobiota bacterium]